MPFLKKINMSEMSEKKSSLNKELKTCIKLERHSSYISPLPIIRNND